MAIKDHPMRGIKGTSEARALMDSVRSHKTPSATNEEKTTKPSDEMDVARRFIDTRSA